MFRQEYNTKTKNKSKLHRIRRLQQFKRQNPAQGLPDAAIQNLLLDPPPHVKSDLKSMDKNKDEGTDQPMTDVSDQNKQEGTDDRLSKLASESGHRWTAPPNECERSKAQHAKLSTDPSNQYGFHVPQYLKMGRSLFQESLANAIPQYRHDILLWLANPQVFNFVKQLVHDAAALYHSGMELHCWNAMIAVAGSTLAQLSSESRDFTRKNYIHWGYPQTERNIRHRQQEIQKRMNQFTAKLNAQMERQNGIGMTAESMEIIRQASNTMIEGHFRRLYVKLNDKLILLQYDMYDIQLAKSFYGMFPNGEQVCKDSEGIRKDICNFVFFF